MLKRENIVFLIFSVVCISIGLFTTYLLSNYFSMEDFGKLQFLLTITGIFTIFYLSGFDIIIQKQIFNENDQIVKYVLQNIMPFALLLLYLIGSLVYIFSEDNKNLVLFAILIATFGLFDKTTAILNSKLKFKQLRYIEMYTKILLFVFAIISIFMKFDIGTYIVYFIIINIIVILIRIAYSSKQLKGKNSIVVNYNAIKKDGFKTTLSTSYSVLASWSEKLILGAMDVVSLAIFIIGQLFPRVLKDNIKVLLTPTLNTWASKGFEYYKKMIYKYRLFFILLGIFLYIIVFFIVDYIISNFFIKYEDSILIAQLLSIPLIFKFVELVMNSSMALSNHTGIFNKINNISNSIKIILVIILVPLFGIYGAVISILTMEFLRFILIIKAFNKL